MARLTRDQADAFARAIHTRLGYVVRARERMERAALTSDPVYQLVRAAEEALHSLFVAVHYRSCDGGTGEPRDG